MRVEETLNLLKGKLQKNDKCFFTSREGFIVVFNIKFRTGMQYVKFMPHTSETYPLQRKAVLLFEGNPVFLRKTRDILQEIVDRFMQLYQWYEGANIFQYMYS